MDNSNQEANTVVLLNVNKPEEIINSTPEISKTPNDNTIHLPTVEKITEATESATATDCSEPLFRTVPNLLLDTLGATESATATEEQTATTTVPNLLLGTLGATESTNATEEQTAIITVPNLLLDTLGATESTNATEEQTAIITVPNLLLDTLGDDKMEKPEESSLRVEICETSSSCAIEQGDNDKKPEIVIEDVSDKMNEVVESSEKVIEDKQNNESDMKGTGNLESQEGDSAILNGEKKITVGSKESSPEDVGKPIVNAEIPKYSSQYNKEKSKIIKAPKEPAVENDNGIDKATSNRKAIDKDSKGETHEEDEDENDEEYEGPDDDEIVDSPAYIPRTGRYYMHDSREEGQPENEPTRSRADGMWKHDRFDERWQRPKSAKEIVKRYGFDIRFKEGAEQQDVPKEVSFNNTRRGEGRLRSGGTWNPRRGSQVHTRGSYNNYSRRGQQKFHSFANQRGVHTTRLPRDSAQRSTDSDRNDQAIYEEMQSNRWNQRGGPGASRGQRGKRYSTQRISNTFGGQTSINLANSSSNSHQHQQHPRLSENQTGFKSKDASHQSGSAASSRQTHEGGLLKDDTVYYDPQLQLNRKTSPLAPRAKKRLEIVPPNSTRNQI